MKKILLPTDFSLTAKNAFDYVKAMSLDLELELTVLHVYHPTVDSTHSYMAIPINELNKQRKAQLKQFVHQDNFDDLNEVIAAEMIGQQLELGFAAEEIVALSETDEYDTIVMGTTGQGGLINNIFGSVSTAVAKKSKLPLWLIPPQARYQKINNILYASNNDSTDAQLVQEVLKVANQFNANIHFVHVNESKKKGDYEMEELLLEQIFRKEAPSLECHINTVHSDSVWEGLYQYAESEDIDLLVLAPRKRKLLDRIMHQSITKKMILKDKKIPLLVINNME